MNTHMFRATGPRLISVGVVILGVALVAAACSATPTAAPTSVPPVSTSAPPTVPPGVPAADVAKLVADKLNSVDTNLALWKIQPGLGTVMIEYGNRLSRLWFAANADNWDMAKYQLDEMTEIQEVGETTRPKRAPVLKAFEEGYLKPMDTAIAAKDKPAFTKAFNAAITGCNACHAAATGTNWTSYKYVEIQTPKIDPATYIDWKGGGQENYIANPPAAAAAVPAALTGNLDAAGVEGLVDGTFNKVDRTLALWNIQPGLGTVMMEYGNRFSRMHLAAKAGNWDMAKYQLDEMIEIQEVGETTRPGRAAGLKAFEQGFMAGLDKAILAQDSKAFEAAFGSAVEGCNACHAASAGANWKSYDYVKIQPPKVDNNNYLVWAAAKPTGSYIASPAAAAPAAPTASPTGTLDMPAVQSLIDNKLNTLDRTLALWNIQPGLGTVMIEYGRRMVQLEYAIKAGNWDMAKYQLDEMIEIQEVGETTRPGRAPGLKAFEDGFLKPMDEAILAQDSAKATEALKGLVTGCNACHAASAGANWSSYGYVQIQLAPTDPADYLKWKTAGGTGSYKP